MSKTMLKTILAAVAAASLSASLGACVAPAADGEQRSRPNHDDSTGSLLHHPGESQTINKDQIDPNQITNVNASQPHVRGG